MLSLMHLQEIKLNLNQLLKYLSKKKKKNNQIIRQSRKQTRKTFNTSMLIILLYCKSRKHSLHKTRKLRETCSNQSLIMHLSLILLQRKEPRLDLLPRNHSKMKSFVKVKYYLMMMMISYSKLMMKKYLLTKRKKIEEGLLIKLKIQQTHLTHYAQIKILKFRMNMKLYTIRRHCQQI